MNALGGELMSAPVHWATRCVWGTVCVQLYMCVCVAVMPVRQGHLGMVVLLMRYGANPEILDKEGKEE